MAAAQATERRPAANLTRAAGLLEGLLFGIYPLLPHRAINRAAERLARSTRPRWLVARGIDGWIRYAGIDMADVEPRAYRSIEDFFLRRLRPAARPLADGIVSPADGILVARGTIDRHTTLRVKHECLSLGRLVNGDRFDLPLAGYVAGHFSTIFLTPHGYHRLHMPASGELVDCRWLPGRYFPQNDRAGRHLRHVLERNERLVLRCRQAGGPELLLVLVGASLVGGIELAALPRRAWRADAAVPLGGAAVKGEEIGHFRFGSTVVLIVGPGPTPVGPMSPGCAIRIGEALYADADRRPRERGAPDEG
jgi:phosphatidylserine decarboxylase